MSQYFIPKFLERYSKLGKRSAIINISSINALNAGSNTSVYGATKAFNRNFSHSMANEYKDEIDVLTVLPKSVITSMNSGRYLFSITA